jgi:hypothetical protein
VADNFGRPVNQSRQHAIPGCAGRGLEAGHCLVIAVLQLGQGDQRRFGKREGGQRPARYLPPQVRKNLPVLRVDAEHARRALETHVLKVSQQRVHGGSVRPDRTPDGTADADDTGGNVATEQRNLDFAAGDAGILWCAEHRSPYGASAIVGAPVSVLPQRAPLRSASVISIQAGNVGRADVTAGRAAAMPIRVIPCSGIRGRQAARGARI